MKPYIVTSLLAMSVITGSLVMSPVSAQALPTQTKTQDERLASFKAHIQNLLANGKITQDHADQTIQRMSQSRKNFGKGMHSNMGKHLMNGKMHGEKQQHEADLLGITLDNLQYRLSSGKTFQQIVADLGLTSNQLQTKALAVFKTHLQEQVTSGKITQAQADQMIARMSQHPFPMLGKGFHRL